MATEILEAMKYVTIAMCQHPTITEVLESYGLDLDEARMAGRSLGKMRKMEDLFVLGMLVGITLERRGKFEDE